MKTIIMCLAILGIGSNIYASDKHNNQSILSSNVIVENKIQVFDTTLLTPHNQYFKVVPQNHVIQTLRIEREITPKEFLIQRIEVPQDYYNERYVVPQRQTVVVEQVIEEKLEVKSCVERYRSYCKRG